MNPWLIGFISWLVPGLGHILQGRTLRGALSGITILVMFILGIMIGGHIYGLRETN